MSPVGEEQIFAEALQQAVRELRATTGVAMVPVGDAQTLGCAVVVGDPLSIFMVADYLQVKGDDHDYAGAVAYHTGRQCVRVRGESPSGFHPDIPFAYAVVATPLLGSGGQPLGVVVLLWAEPVDWDRMSVRMQDRCRRLTKELASELERRGATAPRKRFGSAPKFILPQGPDRPVESVSMSLVYQITRLAAQLTEASRLQGVFDAAVERIMEPCGAQCLAISITDEGRPRLLGHSGCGAELAERLTRASAGTLERAEAGEPACVDHPLFFKSVLTDGPVSAYCLLPLAIGDRGSGTLALGFDHQRGFPPGERAALARMAQLLAPSIGRALQYEAEHRLAQELQHGLLPPALPQRAEVDITTRYVTPTSGSAVGGDWYDVLNLPDGTLGLVIGDVEGHTPRVAATMGQIRSAIRAYAAEGHRPADVLTRTNRLFADLGTDLLATCCCAWLEPETETVEISTAGHLAPLIHRPGHDFTTPELPSGVPLGVQPDTGYGSTRIPLPEGATLVLYTNGLVHSHSVQLTDGIAALHQCLNAPGNPHVDVLADRLLTITGADDRRDDDAALLIAQFLGPHADRRQRMARIFVERHDLRAVADVRRLLREQVRTWDWEVVSSDLELAVTELVTNALVHADSEVQVQLREYSDRLRVDVRDSDPRPPLPAPVLASGEAETEAEHGRGLLIVDALAASWGNSPSGRGKSVWFELSRPPASADVRAAEPAA
ncbi:SpoIIE family protein phosphatase [Streptomyces sp. NPDC006668]|uniref:ATP-binding SpoIIE family protein phosphatase n=1 Tax=Streptomyces sp. NPDC006668 TaxID=3156903 RepID=UPI0033C50301